MSDEVKRTDQVREGESKPSTAIAKASTENFTADQQAQPTEKFTTWSGEEPKSVLLAAKQGETLEEFTARTNQYHEVQAQKAQNKPTVQPFCISGFEDGSEVKAGDRQKSVEATKTKKAHEVADNPHPTRVMPAMTPEAEAKSMTEKQIKHEQISQSATLMAIEAGKNPAMEPVALTRQYADKLPTGHPQKQPLTELTREHAAALSPEMRAHYEQVNEGTVKATTTENLPNTADGWLAVAQKIARLPMDKQLEVIGDGLMAGIKQYQHEDRERAWGQLLGTVQGTGEVLQGMATIADFGAACILGDNERAGKMGEEFGTALGQTIVGGVRLFQAADQYLFHIGYTGDYAKPFRDIAATGEKLDSQWSKLPPREQERIKARLITEMIESGALGTGGARAVQTASKFTEVLDALAVEAKQLHVAAKPTINKAVKTINNAVDELVQPLGDTGMGVKMPIPKDHLRETKMLMSKADDAEGKGFHHPTETSKHKNSSERMPSHDMKLEIEEAVKALDEPLLEIIQKKHVRIEIVDKLEDVFPETPWRRRALGAYDWARNTIFLPQKVWRGGAPVDNFDVDFALRHELGHVVNAKTLEKEGLHYTIPIKLSDKMQGFIEAFQKDLPGVPDDILTKLGFDKSSKEGLAFARDEVFADIYAHATGFPTKNERSRLMKQYFGTTLKFMKENVHV